MRNSLIDATTFDTAFRIPMRGYEYLNMRKVFLISSGSKSP